MDIKEYKCPNCGGAVQFDSSSQMMKCPYCDTEFEIEALEEYQKELAVPTAENYDSWAADYRANEWQEGELDCLTTGSCPSCGAELMGDENTAAMVCPSCGNTQIVMRRLDGILKPDYVIPFKLDKNSAAEALRNFYNGKRLLPESFKEENHINEIQGVYLPFWLYDASAQAHVCYRATRTRMWSDANYNYTKTDHYSVIRDGSMAFEKIPVDGSEKMDDAHMDSIEPFNYDEKKEFQTAFLSGYLAEKYDMDADSCKDRASRRIKNSLEGELTRTVTGYTSVRTESSQVNIRSGRVNYAMFPVWVLNTKHKDTNHQFLMNGQTGLLAGSLPVDTGKAWKYRLRFTGIIGAVLCSILYLLRYFIPADASDIMYNIHEYHLFIAIGLFVVGFALGLYCVHTWIKEMNTARLKTQADTYIVPGSFNLKIKRDRFLYSTITKIRRQTQTTGGGKYSGGGRMGGRK